MEVCTGPFVGTQALLWCRGNKSGQGSTQSGSFLHQHFSHLCHLNNDKLLHVLQVNLELLKKV